MLKAKSGVEKALSNHKRGYNCAQSVACAFCKEVGMDEATMFRISEGLGLGMGNMEGTCGAVSGAVLLAGMKGSSGNLDNPVSKQNTYKISRKIMAAFHEKNGSVTCKELKGVLTRKPLRSCDGCIEDAAKIAAAILTEEQITF